MSMKILTLDIETSPNLVYAWGLWNQNIMINQIVEPTYTLSWAAKWLDKERVIYRAHDAPDFLTLLAEMLDEADAVVHYNGTAFDMKHLMREFVIAGMDPPFMPKDIDLLKTVRQRFKFVSNKLDYVCSQLLGETKLATGGMGLWIACLNGEAWAWKKMKAYNIQDVVVTEKLYERLLPWIKGHPNCGLYVEDQEAPVCRNCGSDHVQSRGWQPTNVRGYQRYKCMNCGWNGRGRKMVKGGKNSPQVLV